MAARSNVDLLMHAGFLRHDHLDSIDRREFYRSQLRMPAALKRPARHGFH
ncbi:MAG: hypothetical protein ABF868_12115 [Sporolactobacillus sp.]